MSVQSDPNQNHVIGAMEALDFLVVQEIFMSETARYADVVLPAATHLEKDGTFVNSDRRVQRVRRVLTPLPGTFPDLDIYQMVAERMGEDLGCGSPPDPGEVTAEMARLSPPLARDQLCPSRGAGGICAVAVCLPGRPWDLDRTPGRPTS